MNQYLKDVSDAYDFVVKSADRLAGSKDQTDFSVETHPKHVLYRAISLKSCYIPFAFKNVTSTYGDTLHLRVTPDTAFPLVFYDIVVTLPHYYFAIDQLLQEINFQLAEAIISMAIPIVFSISLSGINNYLQINTSALTSSFTFYVTTLPDTSKTYIYQMLGLPTNGDITFTFSTLFFMLFPSAFSDDLPFSYLFVHIEQFPTSTYTTGTASTHFAIPTANYKPYIVSGTSVTQNHPVNFEINTAFPQDIIIFRTPERLQRLQIKLTDDKQNSVVEHAGANEWSFILGVLGTKNR